MIDGDSYFYKFNPDLFLMADDLFSPKGGFRSIFASTGTMEAVWEPKGGLEPIPTMSPIDVVMEPIAKLTDSLLESPPAG